MLASVGVMVIVPDQRAREALVEAIGRTGHQAFGVESVDQARARRGRREAGLVVFDRRGWVAGGRAYVQESQSPLCARVMMVADETGLRRSDEFEEEGVEAFIAEPLSELELLLCIDDLLVSERAEAPVEPEEESEPVGGETVPEENEGWAEGRDVEGAVQELARSLRNGTAKVSNISPLAVELQGVVGDPRARVSDMVKLVNRDPNLVSTLLRASNSAAYRGMPRVLDLEEAGRRLGTRRLGEIAQREALRGAFSSSHKGWSRVLGKYWRNAIITAEASRTLAERMNLSSLGAIYTMGLFLDMGLVLITDMYRELGYPCPRDGLPKGDLAKELAARHPALGMLLLKSWEMPPSMLTIALHHHEPDKLPPGTPVSRHGWILGGVSTAIAESGLLTWQGDQLGPDLKIASAALGIPRAWILEAVEEAIKDWKGEDDD